MAKQYCGICGKYVGDTDDVLMSCYCGNEENFSPVPFKDPIRKGGLIKRSFSEYLAERTTAWTIPQRIR